MVLPTLYFTLHADTLCTSGRATIVFWQIGALEMIVHNLKSIANFGNLNVFFFISIKFTWWPIFGEIFGWIGGGRDSAVIIL